MDSCLTDMRPSSSILRHPTKAKSSRCGNCRTAGRHFSVICYAQKGKYQTKYSSELGFLLKVHIGTYKARVIGGEQVFSNTTDNKPGRTMSTSGQN